MSAIGFIVVVFAIGAAVELVQSRLRRRYVEQFVAEHGWTLVRCEHRWFATGASWLVNYSVEVVDQTGHSIEGIAHATGFIRRKAWIDW